MKLRIFILIVVLNMIFISFISSCRTDPEEDKVFPYIEPEKKGHEPDEPPPPPQPPPLGVDGHGITLNANYLSLEEVARDVLCGKYGNELQLLLADEVSKCVSLLADSGIVSFSGETPVLRCTSFENKRGILFDTDYIFRPILKGAYGDEVRNLFNLLMRDDKIPRGKRQ